VDAFSIGCYNLTMVQQLRSLVLCLILIPTFFSARAASADVLFEGYSKIMLEQTHIGYVIQRYEFNPKSKEFSTIYYLRTQPPANDVIESLKARSDAGLKPLGYQYTELAGGKARMVDATFKNDTMTVTVVENGQRKTLAPKKIPKGAFLSSFLGYLMLQGKEGIKVGVKYNYQAIAEEDGGIYDGEAFIKAEEAVNGVSAFKVLNTFKKTNFSSHITAKGEIIDTLSPVQGISTQLVANIQEATAGKSVNQNQLKQLFGAVPKGQDNVIARRAGGTPLGGAETPKATPAASKQKTLEGVAPTEAGKTEGVPGGKGIQIKGSTPEQAPPAKDQ
jgi:hypothetical protein